jgi:hypothetical protein
VQLFNTYLPVSSENGEIRKFGKVLQLFATFPKTTPPLLIHFLKAEFVHICIDFYRIAIAEFPT